MLKTLVVKAIYANHILWTTTLLHNLKSLPLVVNIVAVFKFGTAIPCRIYQLVSCAFQSCILLSVDNQNISNDWMVSDTLVRVHPVHRLEHGCGELELYHLLSFIYYGWIVSSEWAWPVVGTKCPEASDVGRAISGHLLSVEWRNGSSQPAVRHWQSRAEPRAASFNVGFAKYHSWSPVSHASIFDKPITHCHRTLLSITTESTRCGMKSSPLPEFLCSFLSNGLEFQCEISHTYLVIIYWY